MRTAPAWAFGVVILVGAALSLLFASPLVGAVVICAFSAPSVGAVAAHLLVHRSRPWSSHRRGERTQGLAELAAIVESTSDAVIAATVDRVVTAWNRGAERLFGYTAEEMIGQSIGKIAPGELEAGQIKFRDQLLSGEAETTYEAQRVHKDGRVIDVSVTLSALRNQQGETTGFSSIIRDISERKRTERRLAELAQIVETTHDAVISTDVAGLITYWNRAAERLMGWTAAEMIGRPIVDIVPESVLEEQGERRRRALEGKEPETWETIRLRRDGSVVDVSITLSPLWDADGELIGVSAIFHDISERRQLEIERERARLVLVQQNERLRELDRMKDDFVASVSHELRTPLTSIRGYLELVLDGEAGDLNEEQRDFLSVVERNSDRLLRVVGDLLFVAQVDAGKLSLDPAECDLDELVEEAVLAVQPAAAEKEISLDLETGDVESLPADHARLAQMLDNLVSNAVKFTPAGGHVAVRSFRQDDTAVIEVTDSGLGISPDDQEQLFERFFRTASATEHGIQGTGLGLAIVKAIVEAHGGTISVESAVDEGSTFRVQLPTVAREAAA